MPPRFPPARSLPLYAARTGLLCQSCHFDPNGGRPRNDFGFAFAKNRHALLPDTSGPWKDLSLSNPIGDDLPVYLGLNQRFMLLTSRATSSRNIDGFAFFNMENALPSPSSPIRGSPSSTPMDAFSNLSGLSGTFRNREAFGMIGGFPWDAYIKAGVFGRAAFTNGKAGAFTSDPYAEAKTLKLG